MKSHIWVIFSTVTRPKPGHGFWEYSRKEEAGGARDRERERERERERD